MALFKRSRPAPDPPPRRVLIVAAELAPFTTGGASEAVRGTAERLSKLGALVSAVLPRYRRPEIEALPLEPIGPGFWVPLGEERTKATAFCAPLNGGRAFFIDHPKYFLRDCVFGTEHGDYLDNDERFAFFCRAVVEFLIQARLEFDILHCHGWPTALVPLFLGTHYADKPRFRRTATVLSAQDLSAQGSFPPESLAFTGLNWSYFTPERLALNGKFSYLKAGLMFADALAAPAAAPGRPAPSAPDSAPATALPSPGETDGVAELMARRGDSCVTIFPGADSARQYLRLYETALLAKKGGPHGR
jgi:starch synthase